MGSDDTRWPPSLTGQDRFRNAIESGYRVYCNRGTHLQAIVNCYSITVRHEGSPHTQTDVALVRWFFRDVGEALREMDRAQQESSTIASDRCPLPGELAHQHPQVRDLNL